ncbi:hypothetical protein GIB67_025787 [Kingdonia uniflora]|uniref:Uncharacterized protein n=1 Tax=Kingdonia uniflora TaxID=39325 RepID=A0A7J7NT47_9MAGN|nr:hypothetical protein GIB67_025787 [Kingdonia uniflora]
MKDALKREVIIVGNISRKRVLLQSPFGGYEWYLGDRCWAQLEHRAMLYNPPKKLYCFPSPDVVRSLRAAGWIETQHYIVGHHVDYDAYWRHVSHGALMSDITRYNNIGIPCLGALTARVTLPYVEFPTGDFSTQETQIPSPQLGDYPGWIMEFGSPHGTTWHTIPSIATTSTVDVPTGYDFFAMTEGMRKLTLDRTLDLEARHLHDESRITHLTANLRRAEGRLSQLNDYLDGEGIVVYWEDDEGEAGTSQAGTSWGRGSQGRRWGEGHLKVGPLLPGDQDISKTLDPHHKPNSQINFGESVSTKENSFESIVTEDLWLDQSDRDSFDLDQTLATLTVGDCNCGFLPVEALDRLNGLCG